MFFVRTLPSDITICGRGGFKRKFRSCYFHCANRTQNLKYQIEFYLIITNQGSNFKKKKLWFCLGI